VIYTPNIIYYLTPKVGGYDKSGKVYYLTPWGAIDEVYYLVPKESEGWVLIGTYSFNGNQVSEDWNGSPGTYGGAAGKIEMCGYSMARIEGKGGVWKDGPSEIEYRANLRFKTALEHIQVGDSTSGFYTATEAAEIWAGSQGVLNLGEDGKLAWGAWGGSPEDNSGTITFEIYGLKK
jgi:hypothetical protein